MRPCGFGGVIHTKILDESVFIRHVLDVAGKDVNTQLLHVLGSLNHNLVREGITVRVNGPQCKRTDNLTHVALKRILQISGDLGGVLI